MLDRRNFLKIATAAGSAIFSRSAFAARSGGGLAFAVHPFIEDQPEAVFIARTSVDAKTNSTAIYTAGFDFGASVIVGVETGGYPLSSHVAIKPNLTGRERTHPMYTIERSMGIVTDAHFVEGMIERVNSHGDFADGGYIDRDGHFMRGPSLEGLATDYMTNIVIFGKNPFHCDVVGHWLGGHEPGNFGLFHMARERGFCKTVNPAEIAVYEWMLDGTAVKRSLSAFERTPLRTFYLMRDYGGQTEPYWHLVDEPYDYGMVSVAQDRDAIPDAMVVHQNYPNPFNARTTIRYIIPDEI